MNEEISKFRTDLIENKESLLKNINLVHDEGLHNFTELNKNIIKFESYSNEAK